MDAQTIQELEIIIRAQVEEARKDIRKFKKEASGYAKDISNEMNKGFSTASIGLKQAFESVSPEIDEARDRINELQATIGWFSKQKGISLFQQQNLENAKKELQELVEMVNGAESSQVKVTGVNGTFMLDKNTGEVSEVLEEIQEQVNENPIEIPTIIETQSEQPINDNKEPLIEEEKTISNIEKIRQAMKTAHEEMDKLRQKASEFEDLGLNPYEVMSYGDSFKLMASNIGQTLPVLSEFKQAVEQNLNGDFGDSLLQKGASAFVGIKTKAEESINAIKTKFGEIKNSVSEAFEPISSKVNATLDPIKSSFSTLGSYIKGTFAKIKDSVSPLISKLRETKEETKKIKNESKGLGNGFKSFASNVEKGFSNGIKSIKKFTLSLLGVRTIFSAISKASQAYLSFDEDLSKSVQNCWNVLGSLLAPILEYIVGLFTKLVSAVAGFVKALTGIDLVARANAKALDKQSKSAKSASKSLAGIDDIDTLHSNSGGGADTPSLSTSNIDMGPIEEFANKLKEIFSKIFEPMKKAWETTGPALIDSMKTAFENIKIAIGDVAKTWLQVWTNGTGETFCNNILTIIKDIFDIVGGIAKAFDEAWNSGAGLDMIQTYYDAINSLLELIDTIMGSINEIISNGTLQTTFEYLMGIFTSINSIFGEIFNAINNAWTKGDSGTKIFQSVADTINLILGFAKDVLDTILLWVVSDGFQEALDLVFDTLGFIFEKVEEIATWVLGMYDEYLKPVIEEKLIPAFQDVIEMIQAIWNTVKPVIDKIIDAVKKYVEPIIKNVCKALGGVIDVIAGIAKFITGVFTGDWKKAWNGVKQILDGVWTAIKNGVKAVWDAIWGIIKGVINTIIGGAEKFVNTIIKGLNKIIEPLTKIGNTILDAIGIKSFSFKTISSVSFAKLESGDVAYEPTRALIGEYAGARDNPEIVSPVSMMKDSFRDVLSEFDFGGTRFDTLKIDVAGKNFYDDTIDYINDKSERNGVSVIKEV